MVPSFCQKEHDGSTARFRLDPQCCRTDFVDQPIRALRESGKMTYWINGRKVDPTKLPSCALDFIDLARQSVRSRVLQVQIEKREVLIHGVDESTWQRMGNALHVAVDDLYTVLPAAA